MLGSFTPVCPLTDATNVARADFPLSSPADGATLSFGASGRVLEGRRQRVGGVSRDVVQRLAILKAMGLTVGDGEMGGIDRDDLVSGFAAELKPAIAV
jgi:hypothetical protein